MENIIKTYPCGLRMIVRPMPSFKSVATSVHIGTGSRNEEENEFGLSHFVEHMLFKGTPTRSAEQIAKTLSNLGVDYNAYTSYTATCFHTKGLITNLDECCDVLSDMYFNLKFKDDEFHREAEVIVQEIVMHDDNPRSALGDLAANTFFNGTDYGHPIAGSVKSVRAFKPEDIYAYVKKHYTPQNTIISFSGDITVEKAEAMVKKYWLSKYKDKREPNIKPLTGENLLPKKTEAKLNKKINQHNVAVLFPTVNFLNDDRYVLAFVKGIMSSGMSSRLFISVRERLGLVYTIGGGLHLTDIGGYYFVQFSCTPKNTNKVLKTVAAEIERIKREGVTEEEVQKVKNIKRASRLFESEDVEASNQRNVSQLSDLGFIETAEDYLSHIDKITVSDVNAAVKKYLNLDKAIICVVGKSSSFPKM